MEKDALISNVPIIFPPLVFITPGKTKCKVRKAKKATGSLWDDVRMHNMVAELATAIIGMNFGQLLRGDAGEATKQLKRLVAKTVTVT